MALFGKKAVVGRRALVGAKSQQWCGVPLRRRKGSFKDSCVGGSHVAVFWGVAFARMPAVERRVLVGAMTNFFRGSLWQRGSFQESCVGGSLVAVHLRHDPALTRFREKAGIGFRVMVGTQSQSVAFTTRLED